MELTVYQIRNTANGRVYVGSSRNLRKRWREHQQDLAANKHHSAKLQHAWNKYGADAFEFTVLEIVAEVSLLLPCEQRWIDLLHATNRSNYNISLVAGAPMAGRSPSIETRAKLAKAMTGNKHGLGHMPTPAQRAQMSAARLGQKRTAEQRARMSDAQRGNTNKRGWVTPDETRRKLSQQKIGNKHGLGVKHSAETIAKRVATRALRRATAMVVSA